MTVLLPALTWQAAVAAVVTYVVVVQFCLLLISHFSGWNTLAALHPCDGDCPGPRKRFCSVFLGDWTTYNFSVTVSADQYALHLSALPLVFSPTHVPIAINWNYVTAIHLRRRWFGYAWEVEVRDAPGTRLALGHRAFRSIRAAAEAGGVRVVTGEESRASAVRK